MKQLKIIILFILIILQFSLIVTAQNSPVNAREIIEMIKGQTGSPAIRNTVDVIKTGDPLVPVKGIITTMFATMDVLKKAVSMNCNLIIVHEPTFYNHRDDIGQFRESSVYLEKKRFIDENKIVIFRFHDYIHSIKPDVINVGMTKKLGWDNYVTNNSSSMYVIPETTLKDLLEYLKKIFPGNTFNVIGNPEMKLSKVAFSAGAPGSSAHYPLINNDNVDVVLAGEVQQWETYEYVRDAVSQGKNKAIIFLGHVTSEEPGMEYCATWLKGFIKDIPIYFVASGPSYWTF